MNFTYKIQEIPGKGRGVICQDFIEKGSVVYVLANDTTAISMHDNEIEAYLNGKTDDEIREILDHAYCMFDTFYDLSFSDTRFYNHSFDPNCVYIPDKEVSIALRGIHPGDEITEDYFNYSIPPNYDRLMKHYCGGNFRDQSKNWH